MDRMRIWKWVFIWAIAAAIGSGSAAAQIAFERTYGGTGDDYARSVQQTQDGGYIIGGTTDSFGAGDQDVYLIKTDAWGEVVWARTYGGSDFDRGYSVQQTEDGGYIITGLTASFGGWRHYDIYLIKTDPWGDTLWTRVYGSPEGGEQGWSVQQTSDGGYIITGNFDYWPVPTDVVWLLKTDPSGDTLWTRKYRPPYSSSAWAYSVQQTQDGGYIIAGNTWDVGYNTDIYLIKTDPWGDTLWTRTYGDTLPDHTSSVRQTLDGGYIVAGIASWGTGHDDVYLLKTDAWGDSLWAKIYGGPSRDYGWSVQQTQDGGYIVAGLWASGDVWLIKTNLLGDTVGTRTYGGTAEDVGWSVQQTRDRGYIIAGSTRSYGAGERDVYLIKTGPLFPLGLVTGGGWIPGSTDGPGDKRTFGFNAHTEAGVTWGHLQFNDHGMKLKVHGDTVETLTIDEGDTVASFSGSCRVSQDGSRFGRHSFECEVMDRGEPGRGRDSFSIDVYDEDGNLYYSAGSILGGGNIQIHQPDSGYVKGGLEPDREPGDGPNPPESRDILLTDHVPVHSSPNPFTDRTTITFHLPSSSHTTLEIYDITGGLVATLLDAQLSAGLHSGTWKTNSAPSGIYFYRLTGGGLSATRKLVLLR